MTDLAFTQRSAIAESQDSGAAFLLVMPGPAIAGVGLAMTLGVPLLGPGLCGAGVGAVVWGLVVALRRR